MARFKVRRSLARFLKKILKNIAFLVENMETPEANMWSPMDAPTQIYTGTLDSGYNSCTFKNADKTGTENTKMVQTRLKRKELRLCDANGDYELTSFWISAESPYWPCRKKTLQKVDVNCIFDINEDILKRIIKTVYYSYQEACIKVDGTTDHIEKNMEDILLACVKVDGTTDHVEKNMEDILTIESNDSFLPIDKKVSHFDSTISWKVRICTEEEGDAKYITTDSICDNVELSDGPMLRFTAKQNSHNMHLKPNGRMSGILLSRLYPKKHTQKTTLVSASNGSLNLTFHFNE